ncbi:hypothetical protein MO973_29785 [Paenibacillus sp. TRM 82003]|uniref:hypothetical protein n=1 Tax=Kineococcus sp. TRM81007 TaxID=2925831 RepID=UPI001F590C83|nr:hypothetical protein [Kineococcus sp. TRM81007]MCI2238995.1 hypothetical protein [Kineococcus sp. TRM81007]MCI3924415.1 hypothetical protein [Paenibacillus sp. TRM 82003]
MTTNLTATAARTTRRSVRSAALHRRALAAGLIAGVSSVGLAVTTAGTASAAPVTTVDAGARVPVAAPAVVTSPAALPVEPTGTGAGRGTYVVTVSL